MAARPELYPATHDLIHLLLAYSGLDAFLSALADRTGRRLAPLGQPDTALAVYRRNRPVLTAGAAPSLVRLTQERLADDDVYLASALEHSRSASEERLPDAWASGTAWGVDAGLLVVPVPAGPSATAALVLVGTPPADPGTRRAALALLGRVRNEASWALRMAVRLADETDLAEHRAHAMQNRTVIDVAIGVIMAQSRCSADEAFDVLRRASNNRNVKLHTVAAELVRRIHPELPQTAFVD
ncbi:hypothetical protein SA2016_3260 [Sinomonas atrocyanea]|uniref:ANTAR domain-containing protein n=1 Tax=Sinomonas atrocyanea TaxID=37927 RepID=A0A127A3N9_9MICC|nr:ANTAR domain-containing protein [Sinomonas atrocyanea]AMM33923.1 hypothetical protein SA2016_3260 [Sinomonas atrocyanea]GEB63457.1 ANTAR domain-containing protein [Sinomonas atrocyanea]GGG56327.1 ANTAR domain-containing protein [Sinomonas atrocyanea]